MKASATSGFTFREKIRIKKCRSFHCFHQVPFVKACSVLLPSILRENTVFVMIAEKK